MRPIIEGMGLDWSAQHRKLKDHPVLAPTVGELTMVAEDGRLRAMTALPLTRINFWMATIQPNKVPDLSIRERVIAYQNECADALFAYFFGDRAAAKALPPANLQRQPYDEWSLEHRRTALSEVNGMRHIGSQAAALWVWERVGLPMPPKHLLPAWAQGEMGLTTVDGRNLTITVPMNGGTH